MSNLREKIDEIVGDYAPPFEVSKADLIFDAIREALLSDEAIEAMRSTAVTAPTVSSLAFGIWATASERDLITAALDAVMGE